MTSGPGTYVLLIEAPDGGSVAVGQLGTLTFDGGWLLYVGSAFGSGGLRARLRRHLGRSGPKRLHWHVDYLLEAVDVARVWWRQDGRRREEAWADALRRHPAARIPLARFGSGDCGCRGHLIRLPERPGAEVLEAGGDDPDDPASPTTERVRSAAAEDVSFA